MRCSIVMATFQKGHLLEDVLDSIKTQDVPFEYEVIVVDDGSTDETPEVCERFGVVYKYLDRPGARNPAPARNAGYRMAQGEVIIAQSSDTVHVSRDAIERLCEIAPRTFNIATVKNQNRDGSYGLDYTGITNKRPFFFLGSLRRKDLYAIGGDDEDFGVHGYLGCEDDWFADRLVNGRGLSPVYREDVIGCHLWHERPNWDSLFPAALAYLDRRRKEARKTGEWVATGGRWA